MQVGPDTHGPKPPGESILVARRHQDPQCVENYGPGRAGDDGWRVRGAEQRGGPNGVVWAPSSCSVACSTTIARQREARTAIGASTCLRHA